MSACPHPEKYRHQSRRAALKARDSLERVDGVDLTLEPYRCVCGSWHLGHPGKGNVETRIRRALAAGRRNTMQARRRRTR